MEILWGEKKEILTYEQVQYIILTGTGVFLGGQTNKYIKKLSNVGVCTEKKPILKHLLLWNTTITFKKRAQI